MASGLNEPLLENGAEDRRQSAASGASRGKRSWTGIWARICQERGDDDDGGGDGGGNWLSQVKTWLNISRWDNCELKLTSSPAARLMAWKGGLVAAVCSVLCFVPGPLSFLNKNAAWAVIAADLVLETNVGLTFSKGINRTLGTFAAAALALLVNFAAPRTGAYEPAIVVLAVFLVGAVATVFKFRRPFKDRWNIAVAIFMITFQTLVVSHTGYSEKLRLPMIRLVDIVIGFVIAGLVNLSVAPAFAGSDVNELVGSNFERAGNVMERCVAAYIDGTVLKQVPEILLGKCKDDDIHSSFREILSADSEVDKLIKAVPFEWRHGKFFAGYPWNMYEDITDNLRYTLYDVVALDSCLRSEIQAPLHLRHMFRDEFRGIGKECAQVFRLIGSSIKAHRHVEFGQNMRLAEESALLLQHRIAKCTTILLGGDSDGDDIFDGCSLSNPSGSLLDTAPLYVTVESTDFQSPTSDGKGNVAKIRLELPPPRWDTALQKRISALSLVKFASLLLELLAKAKYVVTLVDELEIEANFEQESGSSSCCDRKPTVLVE